MSALLDDVSRVLAAPIPRSRALKLAAGAALAGSFAGLRPEWVFAGTDGEFAALAAAIDTHHRNYIRFMEPDSRVARAILDDYRRAQEIRDEYHRSGTIPDDPLVVLVTEGNNTVLLGGDQRVAVILAEDPTLEITQFTFTKAAADTGYVVLVDGNPAFWRDHTPGAKFVSAAFTMPVDENTLSIASDSSKTGTISTVGRGGATAAEAVIVTEMAVDKRSRVGRRCKCTLECANKDDPNRTFELLISSGCCTATEVARGQCDDRCEKEAKAYSTGQIVCKPKSSICVLEEGSCEQQ